MTVLFDTEQWRSRCILTKKVAPLQFISFEEMINYIGRKKCEFSEKTAEHWPQDSKLVIINKA